MLKAFLLIFMVFGLIACQQIQKFNQCNCSQIWTELECGIKVGCSWDKAINFCKKDSTTDTTTETELFYCDQFKIAQDCANDNACHWNDNKCSYFTDCTVFTYDTDQKCQAASTRCFSDGNHCIEYNVCNAYKTQKACFININGKYCYWNTKDVANPKCEDADDCLKLPTILNTDDLCRKQLSKCTANTTGGCIESGTNCADQIAEVSCVTNKDKSQQCFWNAGKCLNKVCDNAISTLNTDKQCKDFLPTCTTKQGGGCVTRTTCLGSIQAACFTDNTGAECFWNGNQCVNKTCVNATSNNTTNASCQQYLPKCITTGAGCVENTSCEAATIKESCEKTLSGQLCNWDGTQCKLKTCDNAGPNYIGHDQCTAYMDSCTENGASGCTNRTCDNAPLTNNTNDLCNTYLPNSNCITKNGGGCKINTTCESIDIDIACIKDVNGQSCFWTDGACKPKICINSPTDNNSHALCQQFMATCTLGRQNTCVDKICENIQEEENCVLDFNNKPCIYKSRCFKKQCFLASQSIKSFQGCQSYLSTCTLHYSGNGCMELPSKCEAITNINSCQIKAGGLLCGWNGTNCVDRTCLTAPTDGTINTTILCDQYKAGCVINNNLNGCIDLPNNCVDRKQSLNCQIEQDRQIMPKCQWDNQTDQLNPVCVNINCENAHLVSLKGNVSQSTCWSYNSLNCIITKNNNISTCAPRPKICNGLIQAACQQNQVLEDNINCFWDGGSSSCKDFACQSITFAQGTTIDHTACNGQINKCTVDAESGTKCIDLKACNLYTFSDQCKVDNNGIVCTWKGQACVEKSCDDTKNLPQYISQSACSTFSSKCFYNQATCLVKQTSCDKYLYETGCKLNTLNGKQQCSWVNGLCINATGFGCAKVIGAGLTAEYCQYLNSNCSVNATGTACIEGRGYCVSYDNAQDCKWAVQEKIYCTYVNSKCTADCSAAPPPYDLTTCKSYNSECSVRLDGTKCVNAAKDCQSTAPENCVYSVNNGYCQLSSNICASSGYLSVCTTITGGNLITNYCLNLSFGKCSVSADRSQCINSQKYCSDYTIENDCYYALNNAEYCFWTANKTCKDLSKKLCTDISGNSVQECVGKKNSCTWSSGNTCSFDCAAAPGPYFDLRYCLDYDLKCAVKLDGSGCVNVETTCESTNLANCTFSSQGYCYPSLKCNLAYGTLNSQDCEGITGYKRLTASYCQLLSNNKCTAVGNQSQCTQIQTCDKFNDSLSKCLLSQCTINAAGTEYISFDNKKDPCSAIKIFGYTNNYTTYNCKQFKSSCKAKQDSTGCEDEFPLCSSFTGTNLTYYQCYNKFNLCSVNKTQTACIDAKETCAEYSVANCGFATNDGECLVDGNKCVQNICQHVPATVTDLAGCQNYSQNCIVNSGGCLTRGPCNSYITQDLCTINLNGDHCLWNPQAAKCTDKICSEAEKSTYFNNNSKCESVGNCTVQAEGLGCISKAACNSYIIQEQCQTNDKGIQCIWNTNIAKPICTDKSCSTAPVLTYTDHTHCQAYLSGCTVNIIKVNGTPTPQGCISFKSCSEYTIEQCYISSEKDQNNNAIMCGWIGNSCGNKGCLTASNNVNTPQLCSQYYTGCTVNSTNDGCIQIPETCEVMTEQQCFTNSVDNKNRKCMWVIEDNKCVTKTCENSPKFDTESECETHLAGCTVESIKCKPKICEDIPLTTDQLSTCAQAQIEDACRTDNKNGLCQWINGYCVDRTCLTAPLSITTESGCQQYFTPKSGSCTTKLGGGCTTKGACSIANVKAACTIDNKGVQCVWDNEKSICRIKECKDLQGTTHTICNKQRTTCTAGLNGKCATIGNCEAATIKAACIIGNNGPCLWISEYLNIDGTKGACFPYNSCKSLQWTSDQQCKLISPNCTTDGTQCIGITNCQETNINGGCKSGTDGECIQTVSVKGSNDKICKKYTSCDQAYYLTHDECYNANQNCTSDYINGCISFQACASYTQQGQCKFNKDGIIKDTNESIISTGNCVWDSINKVCKDEQCKDLLLSNEQQCSAKLKACSSDGTTCIVKGICTSYQTQNACNNAGGTDGSCFWVVGTDKVESSCRIKTCSDILNGTSAQICSDVSNCVSDGVNCIVKNLCASYINQTSCLSTGTDGLCYWTEAIAPSTQGSCALMTECNSAKNEVTCNQAQNRCAWNQESKICQNHSCETYKTLVNSCTYFYTWDYKKYNVCSLKDGKCILTDSSTLVVGDCFTQTAYQYSWNAKQSKCVSCENLNISNITNQNNENQTDSDNILTWILCLFLMIIS